MRQQAIAPWRLPAAIAIALAALVSACSPANPTLVSNAPAIQASETPLAFTLENAKDEIVPVETIDIPIENCNGTNTVEFAETYTKRTRTSIQFQISGNYEASVLTAAKISVAAQLGINQDEEKEFSRNVKLPVNAKSWVVYQLIWSEIWVNGDLVTPAGERLPFRARKGLRGELSSGKPQICPTVAASQPTVAPSQPPAETATTAPSETLVSASPTAIATQTQQPQPTLARSITIAPVTPTTLAVLASATPTESPVLPTPTPTIVKAFPCEATVKSTGEATVLNILRSAPSMTAQVVESLRPGQRVRLDNRRTDSLNNLWYRVISIDSKAIPAAWIPAENATLSAQCPS